MTEVNKVHVVGISDDGLQGLAAVARERVETADLLIGDSQLLQLIETSSGEKWDPAGQLDEVVDRIAAQPRTRLSSWPVGIHSFTVWPAFSVNDWARNALRSCRT